LQAKNWRKLCCEWCFWLVSSGGWCLEADGSNLDILHCYGAVASSCAALSVQSGSTDLYGVVKKLKLTIKQASFGSCGSQFPEAGGSWCPEGGGIWRLVVAGLDTLCHCKMWWQAASWLHKMFICNNKNRNNQPVDGEFNNGIHVPLPRSVGVIFYLSCCLLISSPFFQVAM